MSPEAWLAGKIEEPASLNVVQQHQPGGDLEAALAATKKLQPQFGDEHVCRVCLGAGKVK